MLKALLLFVSLIFWVAVFTLAVMQREAGISAAAGILPSAPQFAYYFGLLVFGILGMWLNTFLIDILSAPAVNLSEGELKSEAMKNARREMAGGNYRLAAVHLQNAGLYEDALKLAEENKDDDLMARVLFKMGRKRSSRNHFLATHDYYMAANVSVLVGEHDKARKYYGMAADQLKSGDPVEKAGLLDRAQRREEAAKLYEEHGEFGKAAECHDLEGDPVSASRLRDRHETILAYEKKKQGETTLTDVTRVRKENNAKEFEESGDLFGAAWLYREKNNWQRAAHCYERIEEIERAIICYKKANDENKVRELQAKVAPKAPKAQPKRRAEDFGMPATPVMNDRRRRQEPGALPPGVPPPMPPEPGMVPATQFVPLAQQPIQYVPVFVDASQMSQMIQPQPGAANSQWEDFARQLEQRKLFQQASELYMKLGKVDEAVRCLAMDAKPLEAAQMAIGVGDFPKAAEYLVEGLEKDNNPELGLLLGEMLIRIGAPDLAEKLMRRRFARVVGEDNAVFVYKYARLFEDAGDVEHAASLYRELLMSGADSEELEQRLRALDLQLSLDENEEVDEEPTTGAEKEDMSEANVGAYDAAEKLLAVHSGLFPKVTEEEDEATISRSDQQTPRKYHFLPPDHTPYMEGGHLPKGPGREETIHHVSLFGSAARPAGNRQTADTIPQLGGTTATPKADPFKPLQRYEIIRELGKGGMGVVYEAKDVVLERRLALKVINSFDLGAENLKQFLLEARAIAQLTHPNVITIYDVGLIDMRHYIAMEFIDGQDLRNYVNTRKKLGLKEAIGIFIGMCEGLRSVHKSGIIHRDIKPANVLLTNQRQPKIVDFGLAKLEKKPGQSMEDATMFRNAGTPGYMPPEQIQGEELTPGADIYALGITLFAMLVGRPPHQIAQLRMPMDIYAFTMDGILPRISEHREDVPEAIDHLFKYCTAARISDRYQSIDAFLPIAKQWHASLPDEEEEPAVADRDATEKE